MCKLNMEKYTWTRVVQYVDHIWRNTLELGYLNVMCKSSFEKYLKLGKHNVMYRSNMRRNTIELAARLIYCVVQVKL